MSASTVCCASEVFVQRWFKPPEISPTRHAAPKWKRCFNAPLGIWHFPSRNKY